MELSCLAPRLTRFASRANGSDDAGPSSLIHDQRAKRRRVVLSRLRDKDYDCPIRLTAKIPTFLRVKGWPRDKANQIPCIALNHCDPESGQSGLRHGLYP